jgi:predicted DNA-binding ribbon-helix-helix protein
MSRPKKYSVVLSGHATSVTLEPEFWEQLQVLATQCQMSVAAMITMIDHGRLEQPNPANLSSEIRVYLLKHLLGTQNS